VAGAAVAFVDALCAFGGRGDGFLGWRDRYVCDVFYEAAVAGGMVGSASWLGGGGHYGALEYSLLWLCLRISAEVGAGLETVLTSGDTVASRRDTWGSIR
jgi:hypothetical protein